MEFVEFPKIARLKRECMISEKIDGTSAQIIIASPMSTGFDRSKIIALHGESGMALLAGSRTRYITPTDDNFGFAKWVAAHADELWTLGSGNHYGEWWGQGIQRGYGLTEKRFSLFNTNRWSTETPPPACCHIVPVLYRGEFTTEAVGTQLERLRALGSVASPGFMQPEGVCVFHVALNRYFKKTIEKDAEPKSRVA